MKKYQRVAAWIDLDAIEENFEAMRAGLPAGTEMAAVVKANGYGHGAVPIARLLESKDAVWGFAAATIEEALALRSYGIRKPVLVLGYVFPDAYERLVEQEDRRLADEEIKVFVSQLNNSSVDLGLRFWVPTEDYWNVRWKMLEDIKLAFDEAGIAIPFQQMDVTIKQ